MRYWYPVLLLLGLVPAAGHAQGGVGLDETAARDVFLVDPGTHTAPIRSLAFAPGGKLLTFGDDRTVQSWDSVTGQRLRVYRMPFDLSLPVNGELVGGMAISPDGKSIAVAGGHRPDGAHVALVVNRASGSYRTLEGFGYFSRMAYAPDGKRVAGIHVRGLPGEKLVHAFDPKNPGPPLAVRGHDGAVNALAFARDGLLLTGCDDKKARVWNLDGDPANPQAVLEHDAPVTAVAWGVDPSGATRRILTAAGGKLQVWGARGKTKGRTIGGESLGKACKGATQIEIAGLEQLGHTDRFLVAWLAKKDGTTAAGTAVIDVTARRDSVTEGPSLEGNAGNRTLCLAVTPDGETAALTDHVQVLVWQTAAPRTARLLTELPPPPIPGWGQPGRKWGPAGRTVTWRFSEEESERGKMTHALNLLTLEAESNPQGLPDLQGWVRSVRDWSVRPEPSKLVLAHKDGRQVELPRDPSARWVLLPRGEDGVLLAHSRKAIAVELFDPAGRKTVRTIDKKTGFVQHLRGSPDGKYLLTATVRRRLLVHSVATGELLLTLFVAGDDWVAWTKEGYYAASPGGERMLGFAVQERPGHLPIYHPAVRFRKRMYRPELISAVMEKGSVEAAFKSLAGRKGVARGEADLAKLLPPRVTALTVQKSGADRVTVRVTAEPAVEQQPVASLQLLLDGQPVKDATRAFGTPVRKGEAKAEWTVPLPPGSHRVAVRASGPDTNALAEHGEEVEGPAVPRGAEYDLHVRAFGVSKYANHGKGDANARLNLAYADKDAREIADVLAASCGKSPLHKADKGNIRVFQNEQVTPERVLDELKGLANVNPGDLVVIYFSGHGERDDDGNLWLLTHGADCNRLKDTCLSGEKLKEALENIPCRKLLILDACHSAAVGRSRGVANDLSATLTDDAGVFVLVASRGREYALEGVEHQETKKRIENGLCTWALKEALQGKAPANPYDGWSYSHDVFQHVYQEVDHHSGGQQHPYLGAPFGSKPLPLVWRGLSGAR